MPILAIDDVNIHYEVDDFTPPWKTPETIFLHHAAIGNTERWRFWIPTLARNYRVVRMDARGHGESSKPPRKYDWSIERLARDAHDLIQKLDVAPVHFVGQPLEGLSAFNSPTTIQNWCEV